MAGDPRRQGARRAARGAALAVAEDLRDVLRRTADDVELLMSSAWDRTTEIEHTMGQQIIGRINEALAKGGG